YLLALFSRNGTVSPTDAAAMISLTPTKRVEWMISQAELKDARPTLDKLLAAYERFLSNTDASEDELVAKFLDKNIKKQYWDSAFEFGDLIFEAFSAIGNNNRFHRLLVV